MDFRTFPVARVCGHARRERRAARPCLAPDNRTIRRAAFRPVRLWVLFVTEKVLMALALAAAMSGCSKPAPDAPRAVDPPPAAAAARAAKGHYSVVGFAPRAGDAGSAIVT